MTINDSDWFFQYSPHADWAEGFLPKYKEINGENITAILHEEIGLVFKEVLQDADVFKRSGEG